MKIAVFLDVDKTLTINFIQQEYARVLNCETEYLGLEAEFQSTRDSAKFGRDLIRLFASKGFTEGRAVDNFAQIALQEWTDEMLHLPKVDKYLISSGPSYYIDTLARQYGIPEQNTCRSVYRFNPQTHLIESCAAIGSEDKADFVKRAINAQKIPYAITIGVGDSPLMDGPFVAHCTIRLMTVPTDQAIYIPEFKSVILLIRRLSDLAMEGVFDPLQMTVPEILKKMTFERWAFVGSSIAAIFGAGIAFGRLFK